MKKITAVTFMLICFCVGMCNAQIPKGKIMIGTSSSFGISGTGPDIMSLGFTTISIDSDSGVNKLETQTIVSGNFTPRIGLFVVNNLAIGLSITYAAIKTESSLSNAKYSESLTSAGPFVRYYMTSSKVRPFVELSASFGMATSKYVDDGYRDNDEFSNTSIGGSSGFAIPIGEKSTFDFAIGYISLVQKLRKNNNNNNRTIAETLGLKFGFTMLLGRSDESISPTK